MIHFASTPRCLRTLAREAERRLASLAIGIIAAVATTASADEPSVHFNEHIRPIFAQHCAACHGGVKQESGLSLVYEDNVLAGGDSGAPAVVPGDPEASYLLERVSDPDPDSRMPPPEHGSPLSSDEIARLRQWIRNGARWEKPWAWMPPRAAPLPQFGNESWCRDPLDRFVLAGLEREGLSPSPSAKRVEWLRRVSFDLVGLPPSLAEVTAFDRDRRPDAFERVVDRLLASPHFGERWAAVWLDLARYADTTGYEQDPHRDIWPYRDWVIRAFNDDMPYDEFTVKQLAGDLLPQPTFDDRLATAFHRNTPTNTEGGTDDEEFRVAAVIDRVNTTWQVWQATTFGCVQCHSHPYDPIRHEEYYRFLALLDNTRDADVDEELPRLDVPLDPKDRELCEELARRRAQQQQQVHRQVLPLAEDMGLWHNLRIDGAESTGSTRLRIHAEQTDDALLATEVWAEGTVTLGSKFTLESPLPESVRQLTALRIDALARDAEAARHIAEPGFMLSRLEAVVLSADGGRPAMLKFKHAFSDEADPLVDPADSLREGATGWASYSRQWRSHFAVFLLEQPVAISPGSRIRLTLHQQRAGSGDGALVIGRGRYWVSASDAWTRLQQSPEFVAAQGDLAEVARLRHEIPTISIPVMQELPEQSRRSTYVFTRGLWLDKGEQVQPATPEALPSLRTGAATDRLGMARWLVAPENPLTSRVMVNRVWEQLFGTGIVETAEDFGTSGTLPSHPELLDHLALRFQGEYGWSLKRLLRAIVLSATYRQSSRATPAGMAADPQNRLLWRGPRQRLTAEMVRDQALMLSGLWSPKMYGPPVMPPQPDGIWRSVYSSAKWETATDEDRYRRAIYTYWKRTSGYPGLMTFDMPSREVCTVRRIATNTPLQALVTLNDETYMECAVGLADRMAAEGGAATAERIAWVYRTVAGRPPEPRVLEELSNLYQRAFARFAADDKGSRHLGKTPDRAALAVVASTILNLDEVLTK